MSTPSLSVAAAPATAPSTPLVLAMAAGAGFSVASLYYSQPMLGLIAQDLGAGERAAGLVPTLTQLGYALGILLLAPLGDRFDRRNLILLKSALLALALGAAAMAGHLPGLLMASSCVTACGSSAASRSAIGWNRPSRMACCSTHIWPPGPFHRVF